MLLKFSQQLRTYVGMKKALHTLAYTVRVYAFVAVMMRVNAFFLHTQMQHAFTLSPVCTVGLALFSHKTYRAAGCCYLYFCSSLDLTPLPTSGEFLCYFSLVWSKGVGTHKYKNIPYRCMYKPHDSYGYW